MTSLLFIHVIGMAWTSNANEGIQDLKTKMTLLLLPMVFFTTAPLSKKEFHILLYCFLLGSFVNVTWCYIYSFVLHKNEVARSASRFMSHIRLGLYLNVAISACVYFIWYHKELLRRGLFLILILVFLFGMYALGLASGFVNFFILCFLAGVYLIFRQSFKIKIVLILVLGVGIYFVSNYVIGVYNSQIAPKQTAYNTLQEKNKFGVPYFHLDTLGQKENGNYVHRNLDLIGLGKQWNKRCPEDTFSYDPQVNLNRFEILIRYLSSKELTKDSVGVWQLTEEDLRKIKNNKVNYLTDKWSYLHKRVYEIVYEIDEAWNGRDINGHSLSMRPYFWKAALHIVKNNSIIGVGTGDVQTEMNKAYVETNSPLSKKWYKRPHNQFLTITVALGFIGLIVFLVSLFWPVFRLRKYFHVLFWPFFYLAISSFLLEDTLESQAGLTFFNYFNSLFIALAWFSFSQNNAEKAEFAEQK
ncbi:MAG: Lipid core - O-antigen ligase [Bacteroidetes bacterium]|nr:Lipid core - O-antigen ligase [Bacteroidota bacterium]